MRSTNIYLFAFAALQLAPQLDDCESWAGHALSCQYLSRTLSREAKSRLQLAPSQRGAGVETGCDSITRAGTLRGEQGAS
eukprot:scaffold7795_cov403-Prasinococcus_capsulatus_cf.AAC.3